MYAHTYVRTYVLQMYRKLQNFKAEQPYSQAWYYMTVLLVDHCWRKEDLMTALEGTYVQAVFIHNLYMDQFHNGGSCCTNVQYVPTT